MMAKFGLDSTKFGGYRAALARLWGSSANISRIRATLVPERSPANVAHTTFKSRPPRRLVRTVLTRSGPHVSPPSVRLIVTTNCTGRWTTSLHVMSLANFDTIASALPRTPLTSTIRSYNLRVREASHKCVRRSGGSRTRGALYGAKRVDV